MGGGTAMTEALMEAERRPETAIAPALGLSDEEAAARRVAGQGNDAKVTTGRTYQRSSGRTPISGSTAR